MKRFNFMLALVLMCSPVFAIDSLADLLKKAAKADEKLMKKKPVAASFTLNDSEHRKIECVFLWIDGEWLRYQRKDGAYLSTPKKDATDVQGAVTERPYEDVAVHIMWCGGGYCKPTISTARYLAGPWK